MVPSNPKIYHITHVDNLRGIIADNGLLSDAKVLEKGGPTRCIGISSIKRRRLEEIEVTSRPGTKFGEYVPFYFCPRSIMLYLIYRANHQDLIYREGQDLILHFEADLYRTVQWADNNNVPWAFSLSNAGSRLAEFRSTLESLDELDWDAIFSTDFRHPDVKERKQAEFLVYGFFPFILVERIGVYSAAVRDRVMRELDRSFHQPVVEVCRDWYF